MRRIGIAFVDNDPNRQRLHREVVENLNTLVGSVAETGTPPTANTEFAVEHGLGKIPSEFQTLMSDAAGTVYRSSVNRWSDRLAYLKFSASGGPSVRVKLRFR